MFTGLIRTIGTITNREGDSDVVFTIASDLLENDLQLGASIACNGVCLTVTSNNNGTFQALASTETLQKTTFSHANIGQMINLEPSLRLGDTLGGHLVFGHVDGMGIITDITGIGDSHDVAIKLPPEILPFVVTKGSFTINGVSLTPNQIIDNTVYLRIIPHTWKNTTFGVAKIGDSVNLEIDMLARYVHDKLNNVFHQSKPQ